MEISEKIAYWLDIAEYDMETAQSMHKNGRYLYAVFMCQQATEKMLKALHMQKYNNEAPFTHNLVYLLSLLNLKLSEDYNTTAATLTTYYIEGRYPSYKNKLSTLVDCDRSNVLVKKTEDLFAWLKSQLQL